MTVAELIAVLAKINALVRIPSNGRHAYSHFMRDFDEIRRMTDPFVFHTIKKDAAS